MPCLVFFRRSFIWGSLHGQHKMRERTGIVMNVLGGNGGFVTGDAFGGIGGRSLRGKSAAQSERTELGFMQMKSILG